MNTDRFREFLVLADCLNYSQAAARLYITQPVLSRHIYELEQEIGAKLFVRDTHRVRLTKVGELCVREFDVLLGQYDHAMQKIMNAAKSENQQITVAFLGNAVEPFFMDFLMEFHKRKPEIKLDFVNDALDSIINLVNTDRVDLAFVTHVNAANLNTMESMVLMHDSLCLLVPEGSHLADREQVSIRDLANYPLIQLEAEKNYNAYDFNVGLFKKMQTQMNIVKEVSNVETGVFYVDLGTGGFLVPKHLLSTYPGRHYVTIPDEECQVVVHAVWKKNNTNPALPDLVEGVKAYFDDRKAHSDE